PNLDDEEGILQRQLQAFRKRLRFAELSGVIRRYESLRLLDQSVIVLDRRRSRLAKAYRRLTETLITDNRADRDGTLRFLHQCAQQYLPDVARPDANAEARRALGIADDPPSKMRIIDIRRLFEERLSLDQALGKIIHNFWEDAEVLFQVAQCQLLGGDLDKA